MSVSDAIIEMVCHYYENFDFSRSSVMDILKTTSDFIEKSYNVEMEKYIISELGELVNEKARDKIRSRFDKRKNPFEQILSECKLMTISKNKGLYSPPNEITIPTKSSYKLCFNSNKMQVIPKYASIVTLPLEDSLLFKIENLLIC